jgi:hypothetical protein
MEMREEMEERQKSWTPENRAHHRLSQSESFKSFSEGF